MTTINKPSEHPLDLRKYQSIIDTYCKNANINIIINNNFQGLARTDVSDLKKPSMEINLKLMMDQFKLTADQVLFIVFHEVEHLLETAALRNSSRREAIENKQQQKYKERGKYAKTYHDLENVIRDAFVNNEVVSVRKAPVLYDTRQTTFREKTHTDIDLRQLPKHMQLLNAINRECVIPEEKCLVDDDVRKIINNLMKKSFLSGKSLIDDAISGKHLKGGKFDPNLAGRLTYMWDKIEPIYKKLFDEDMKKAKDDKNNPPKDTQNQDPDKNSDTQSNKKQEQEEDQQKKAQQKQIEDLMNKLKEEQKKKKKQSEKDNDKEKKEGNDKEGEESDKEGKDSDKEGEESDKEGKDSDKEGEESDKEGKDSDKEGEESDKEGKDSDKEGEESDKEGKDSDKEGEESDKEGKDSDKEGEESDKEGKDSDKEGEESDKEGKDSDKEGEESDKEGKKKQTSQPKQSSQEKESNEAGKADKHERELDRSKDNPFEPYYERDENELQEILQKSLTQEQIEELIDRVTEHTREIEQNANKSEDDIQLEQRLESMGIARDDEVFEEVKDLLRHYDTYINRLENMRDADTGKNAIEMIMEIFQKIKSNRGKSKIKQIGPVDIEQGSRLHGPKIAEGIAEIMTGEYNPEMFQKDVKIEYNEKESVGEFDVTVICDGSGSMSGYKNSEQKKAALLIFESLKRLYDKIQRENTIGHEQKITFNTDGKIFMGNEHVEILKRPSPDFTDQERMKTFQLLDYDDGNNTDDYCAVRKTYEDIISKGPKYLERIKKGEIKRIVLVITDGGSSNADELKKYIRELRKLGVLVYGIGVGGEYEAVLTNYNTGGDKDLGYGVPCQIAEKLPSTLLNILKPHLENL